MHDRDIYLRFSHCLPGVWATDVAVQSAGNALGLSIDVALMCCVLPGVIIVALNPDVDPLQMATQKKRVNLSRLPPVRKRAAWNWLLENRPEQAALIESEDFQAAVKAFNGEIIIEIEVESK